MAKKLFVGSLPFDVTEDQLHALFVNCGQVVSTTLITDKFTGQSRGFGFVEMSTDAEADEAVKQLNGKEVGGRTLTVNEARPAENRGPRSGSGGGRSGGGGQSRFNR